MPSPDEFYRVFVQMLLRSSYAGPNPDGTWRFGPPPADATGRRMFQVPESAANDAGHFATYHPFLPGFARAYAAFEDELSRRIMILLMLRRILGPERTALNITNAEYTQWMSQLDPLLVRKNVYAVDVVGMALDLYDLNQAGMPIRVHTSRSSLLAHFFLKQYEFNRDNILVTVEPGDTVVEGGMCFGDTALLFAHMAGESGRVVGYEFEPNNLKVMAENFGLNPDLAKRITVLNNALAAISGEEMVFTMAGPATMPYKKGVHEDFPKVSVKTLTVDDMVEQQKLEKVDFIKLDVEGAELETMRGAVRTLKAFRPKLALSAYHKIADIPELIGFIQSLDLGYKFWLDHFRAYDQETIIFAKV